MRHDAVQSGLDFGGSTGKPLSIAAPWRLLLTGRGRAEHDGNALRLETRDAHREQYSNAQLDDYGAGASFDFRWLPPVTLTVKARFSGQVASNDTAAGVMGTAGFGFWNHPFFRAGHPAPVLPQAAWFFGASPPSDMQLDLHTPGWGWKAATLDAGSRSVAGPALLSPALLLAFQSKRLYRRLWPAVQRALRVREALVSASVTEWRVYELAWERSSVRFAVDGRLVLEADAAPRGPLGLVVWIDNQYLVAKPRGRLRNGLLDAPGVQWLELAEIAIR